MPTLRLTTHTSGPTLQVAAADGRTVDVLRSQFRCLLRLTNTLLPRDALIDTGAPLTCFPETLWQPLRAGVDFEWLSFDSAAVPPVARMAGWSYTFRMARFLTPVTLMDYTTSVDRPGVIAAFATGNPPSATLTKALPPVAIGLWGGLLDGGRLAIDRNPATGQVAGELGFA